MIFCKSEAVHSLTLLKSSFASDLLFQVQEALLVAVIKEHITLIHCSPLNLEYHAALANAYVMLSSLYKEPLKQLQEEKNPLFTLLKGQKKSIKVYKKKARRASELALEELKILKDFASNDPWVHRQLANSYRDLGMKEQEILEYETLMELKEQDSELLFTLGILYFEHSSKAKGLAMYEQLKELSLDKAQQLIQYYDRQFENE